MSEVNTVGSAPRGFTSSHRSQYRQYIASARPVGGCVIGRCESHGEEHVHIHVNTYYHYMFSLGQHYSNSVV